MTEDNPFAEFQMGEPAAPAQDAPKVKRGRKRGHKPAVLRAVTNTDIKQAVEKKTRKPRAAKLAVKMDIGTILPALAGLKEDDAKLLMQIVQVLQASNKKSRTRIVAALGKIFA